MCSLEPGDTWKDWKDPYGNKIRVIKNTCKITERKDIGRIYDIYCKAGFDSISRHSYWCCFTFCDGKDWFWFIGNDGTLRLIIRDKDNWKAHPPAISGYKMLSIIADWYLVDDQDILYVEDPGPRYTDSIKVYLTPWPPEDQMKKILEENKIVKRYD